MAHNSYLSSRGSLVSWALGSTIDPTELWAFELGIFKSINGDDGGTWVPSSVIEIGGAGMRIVGSFEFVDATCSTVTTDDLTVNGNTILGDAGTDTVVVNGTTTINSDVALTGTSTLSVNGTINTGAINTTASCAIGDGTGETVTVNSLLVANNLTTFNNTVSITGTNELNVQSAINTGSINTTANCTIGDGTGETVTINSALVLNGSVTAPGLIAMGSATVAGSAVFGASTSDTLVVNSTATFAGALHAQGALHSEGSLYAQGVFTTASSVIGTGGAETLTVNSNTTCGGNMTLNGAVFACNSVATFGGAVTASSGILASTLNVEHSCTIGDSSSETLTVRSEALFSGPATFASVAATVARSGSAVFVMPDENAAFNWTNGSVVWVKAGDLHADRVLSFDATGCPDGFTIDIVCDHAAHSVTLAVAFNGGAGPGNLVFMNAGGFLSGARLVYVGGLLVLSTKDA